MNLKVGDEIQVLVRGERVAWVNSINWVYITGVIERVNDDSISILWLKENKLYDVIERTDTPLLPLKETIEKNDLIYIDWGVESVMDKVIDNKTVYRLNKKTLRNRKIEILLR